MPKISVVTVCYNSEKTILEAVSSVCFQQGIAIEHIIIDGGSTDNTLKLLNQNGTFTKLLSEKDEGIYDAMDKGLRLATGEFTGFLNSDDFYKSSDSLASLFGDLDLANVDAVCGVVEQIDESSETVRVIGGKTSTEAQLSWGVFPPHPATFIRTALMVKAGGFSKDFRIVGDMDIFLRCKDAATRPFVYKTLPLVKMRIGGLSSRGLSSYFSVGREMLMALRRSNRPANPVKIMMRALLKFQELRSVQKVLRKKT